MGLRRTRLRARSITSGDTVVIVFGDHQIPSVEAVLTSIRNKIARLPNSVLWRLRKEKASASAVDTSDLRKWRQHTFILADPSGACHDLPNPPRILRRMRVVAGELGGRRLVAPEGISTRPTTDRVREAIFNSLGSAGVLEGALVADLFAGSGAIGIEALSRGAEHCVFVERDRQALHALDENIDALDLSSRVKVLAADAGSVVGRLDVDIVFADPPYDFDGWDRLLGSMSAGLVVAESGAEIEAPDGWMAIRTKKYGRTRVTFLERIVAEEQSDEPPDSPASSSPPH